MNASAIADLLEEVALIEPLQIYVDRMKSISIMDRRRDVVYLEAKKILEAIKGSLQEIKEDEESLKILNTELDRFLSFCEGYDIEESDRFMRAAISLREAISKGDQGGRGR